MGIKGGYSMRIWGIQLWEQNQNSTRKANQRKKTKKADTKKQEASKYSNDCFEEWRPKDRTPDMMRNAASGINLESALMKIKANMQRQPPSKCDLDNATGIPRSTGQQSKEWLRNVCFGGFV